MTLTQAHIINWMTVCAGLLAYRQLWRWNRDLAAFVGMLLLIIAAGYAL